MSELLNVNEQQIKTIEELRRILPGAHMVNVRVRIDGEWREFQADWLRELLHLEEQYKTEIDGWRRVSDETGKLVRTLIEQIKASRAETKEACAQEVEKLMYSDSGLLNMSEAYNNYLRRRIAADIRKL